MNDALRVLIVEDEVMVAMLVEDMVASLGHAPVGPVARLDEAMAIARDTALDLAILDININGLQSFPVADILTSRDIPVIFATGYGTGGLSERFAAFPVIAKPFTETALASAIKAAKIGIARHHVAPPR